MGRPPKKPTTRMIIEQDQDEGSIDPGDVIESTADDLDFDTFTAELHQEAGRTYECKVYATPQGLNSKGEFLFVFAPGQLTLTGLQLKLQSEYGPGLYALRTFVRGIDETGRAFNQLVPNGTHKLNIGAKLGGNAQPGGFNPLAIAGGDKASMELIKGLLESKGRPAQGIDPMISLLMDQAREQNKLLMVLLMGMLNRKSDGPDPFDQLTKLVTLQKQLGLGMDGGTNEDESLGDRILGVVERLGPPIVEAVASGYRSRHDGPNPRPPAHKLPGAPVTAQPREAPPQFDPKLILALQSNAEAIARLPMAIQIGTDPVKIADLMLDKIETDAEFDELKALLTHPQLIDALCASFDGFTSIRAKLEPWIASLRDAVVNAEVEDDPDAPPAGGTGDVDPANTLDG